MWIAYYSTDEVNRALVCRWASRVNTRLMRPTLSAAEPRADAKVFDLDFLPDSYRAAWVSRLLAGEVRGPVLVHGHRITDAEAGALSRRGVNVSRGCLRRSKFLVWLAACRSDAPGALKLFQPEAPAR
ncbi:MAG TPA: hypothetical protein VKE40_21085 [Gemmataceae bacterium]|nr:hypothetical protein [Gemmataceae bacterium]